MDDELGRLERARRQLEEARGVHVQKRRTLEKVRAHAELGGLDEEQMEKLARAEEALDREVELHDARARKLEVEAIRVRLGSPRPR